MDNYYRQLTNVRVIDGDTVRGDIDLGFNVKLTNQTIRLHGVNAFETTRRGNWDNNLTEKEIKDRLKLGDKAKAALIGYVDRSSYVYIRSKSKPSESKGKYGRWLAELWLCTDDGDINFNEWLIDNDLGTHYFG